MERIIQDNWRDKRLSEHFKLGEAVVSFSHPEMASKITPTTDQVSNLYLLFNLAMEPLREEYGVIDIDSGLRSVELNKVNNGTQNSQHLYGEAIDFKCRTHSMLDPFLFCKVELKWKGELIYYRQKGHIHIALPSPWVVPNIFIKEI